MDESETRDPITGVQIEQSDVPLYLPGTPTLSFTTNLERLIGALFR
ncbi:hypothetical protein [Natrononativus amylolyticus]|nr:hypothetical protein [Natrononativus amylolyticus]